MKKINVEIPEPCHENWDLMPETERGKYCKQCDKEVFDFTELNEDEFQKTFSEFRQSRSDVCGKFRNSQLNNDQHVRYIEIPYRSLNLTFQQQFIFSFIFAFFLGGFSSCKVNEVTAGVPVSYPSIKQHLTDFDKHCNDQYWVTTGPPVVTTDSTSTDSVSIPKDTIKDRPIYKMNFAKESAELTPETINFLDSLIRGLRGSNYKIEVIGHTDNRGTEQFNKELSLSRAKMVSEYLINKGVKVEITRGVGYQYPVSSNASEVGRSQNRRVEILVTIVY